MTIQDKLRQICEQEEKAREAKWLKEQEAKEAAQTWRDLRAEKVRLMVEMDELGFSCKNVGCSPGHAYQTLANAHYRATRS